MSDVYEVEDLQLGERVALKTIRPEITIDAHARERFKREIHYAKRVTHPNVCRIHDLGSHREGDSEVLFLTMELLTGDTLREHLGVNGRMPRAIALPLVIQMADALAAAHSTGIIHRDFKTSNVMLVDAGGIRRAIVTDFGIALASVPNDDGSLTETGKLVGTPAYMAPEQLIGGKLTPATDIYALGLVIYEMVAGRKPFEGKTPLDSAMKRLHETPASPSVYAPDLDASWTAVIMRCLERDPERRFQSALEIVEALTGPARSATLERIQAISKKKTTRVTVALVTIAVIVVAALSVVWAVGRHRPSAAALRWYEQGTRALRDGTSFTAMNALDEAVRLDPKFALAHARLAEAAMELGYDDKAKGEMLRVSPALESFFLSSQEKLRLEAVYYALLKDFTQAAAKYKELAAKVPATERAAVLVDLGRVYEGGGKFDGALTSYGDSIALDNQFAAAFVHRAVLEGRQRLNTKAVSDFDAAEHLYQTGGNAEGIAEVLYQRALLLRRTGKLGEARAPAEKALDMARNNQDEFHQIKALLMLSSLLYNVGDTDGGESRANEAIELAHRAGIESLSASGLVDVGSALFVKGDNAAAEPYLRNALETARRFDDVQVEARAEMILEQVLAATGRPDEAFAVSKQAMKHFEQAGDKSNAARAAIPAARILRDRGDYDASVSLFREELQLADRAKDDGVIALAAQGLGMVLQLQEQYPVALENFERSSHINHLLRDINAEAYSEVNRADALRSLGKYEEAEKALENAERLDQRLNGLKPLVSSINFSRAEMDLSRFRMAEAEQDVRKMTEAANTAIFVASGKRFLGLQGLGIGRTREGLDLCQQAVKLAKTLGSDSLLKNSELALAQAKLATRDSAGAIALGTDLAKYFGEKGQHESELKALAIAISASRGADRDLYVSDAKISLAKLRQQFGESFSGFAARPDIRLLITHSGLTSGIE